MSRSVGPKGQVVIEKEIRDRLGVEPGWRALQVLVDDHVEIYFLPPEHRRSIAGCLSDYVGEGRGSGTSEALGEARAAAWGEAAKRRMADGWAENPERAG
jgi:AbrB family looped-hinge helix DNA binding protein